MTGRERSGERFTGPSRGPRLSRIGVYVKSARSAPCPAAANGLYRVAYHRTVVDLYTAVFLGLLVAYMAYSLWARLDGRLPVAAALVLLAVAAILDALGASASANTVAEFVFFLLGAGVVLLLIEHLRAGRRAPSVPTATVEPTTEGVQPSHER